ERSSPGRRKRCRTPGIDGERQRPMAEAQELSKLSRGMQIQQERVVSVNAGNASKRHGVISRGSPATATVMDKHARIQKERAGAGLKRRNGFPAMGGRK